MAYRDRGQGQGRGQGRNYHQGGQGRPGQGRYRRDEQYRRDDGRRNQGPPDEGGNAAAAAPQRREFFLGYRKLMELKDKDRKDALMYLNNKNNGFRAFMVNEENLTKPDCIELLLDILVKCSEERTMPDILNSVLNEVINSKFISQMMPKMTMNMAVEKRREKQDQYRRILKQELALYEKLMLRCPTQAYPEVFTWSATLSGLVPLLKAGTVIIDDEILSSIRTLTESTEYYLRNATVTTEEYRSAFDQAAPPDDFRKLSTIPTTEDLHIKEEPFLRVNKTTGAYNDVDHYLDVQYRLLREDFIGPLREGIDEYLQRRKNRRKLDSVILYENVKFVKPECSSAGIVYTLQLDMSGPLSRIRWQSSKRLIFGSLVCLSRDNFETFLIATVHERKADVLESKGQITVQLPETTEMKDRCSFEASYVMLETTAYFESYRHVLKGLQEIDQNMAFKEHIVFCSDKVQPPTYLKRTDDVKLDFTPILLEDTLDRYKERFKSVPALEPSSSWPRAHHLGLDDSQWMALVNAITRRLSIVQGPPGTGKTFIGLKVARLLLSNYKVWADDGEAMRPILVVCYTNHALDQFLEGILKFTEMNEIVRVGGRSKSVELEACMLKTLRRNTDKRDEHVAGAFQALRDNKDQLFQKEDEINAIAKQTENAQRSIMPATELEAYMTEEQSAALDYDYNHGRDRMKEWLGFSVLNVKRMLRLAQAEQPAQEGEEEDEPEIIEEAEAVEAERALDIDDEWDEIFNGRRRAEVVEDEDEDPEWGNLNRAEKRLLKRRLMNYLRDDAAMTEEQAEQVHDVWRLRNENDRWRLYRYWKNCYLAELNEKVDELHSAYMDLVRQRNEIMNEKDAIIMRNAKVIGMTTTGCARYRKMLTRIQPKIVIVEEAAEVLEAHIVTSLSNSCEHLIMIGDHKQLRPNPAVYKLAKKYQLEISLFERLIKNKLPYVCLEIQHRMRPCISEPMRFIYPELKDAESVKKYESVKGVSTDLFYIDHGHAETPCIETRSHSNRHEAEFTVQLCRYLLQQDYQPSQITILTPYYGQLLQFKDYIQKKFIHEMKDVRITVVDNFQGEENDIILLSLVRSNSDGNIGFLKTDNRVCVALSRARKGLYIIGNFQLLKTKTDLWTNIEEHMRRQQRIGESLELKCQIHSEDTGVLVSKATDFDKVSEGGCSKMCEFRLQCGHTCPRQCHIYDRNHIDMTQRCSQPCARTPCGNENHRCKKRCNQDCGPCQYPAVKILPQCGHKQEVKCGEDLYMVPCKHPCPNSLPCGHKCPAGCSRPCTEPCKVLVERRLKCGHTQTIQCSKPVDEAVCRVPCKNKLECSHECKGNCSECRGGLLHRSCTSKCERPLVCSHICKEPCTKDCPPCAEKCQNRCIHSKCQRKCGEACIPCKELCEWQCVHKRCTKLCHQICDRDRCNEPCTRQVPPLKRKKGPLKSCGHPCIGLCGEPCPKLCRVCDKDKVEEILFGDEDEPDTRFVELSDCGHVLSVSGLDHWMDTTPEDDRDAVKLKTCPKCQVGIRQHLRYGNIVKRSLRDIERVKQKIRGDVTENDADIEFIRKAQLNVGPVVNRSTTDASYGIKFGMEESTKLRSEFPNLKAVWDSLRVFMHGEKPHEEARTKVVALRTRAEIMERISGIIEEFEKTRQRHGVSQSEMPEYDRFTDELEHAADYILWTEKSRSGKKSTRLIFSEQQLVDLEWFITRLRQFSKYLLLEAMIQRRGAEDKSRAVPRCRLLLNSIPYRQREVAEVNILLKEMEKMTTGLGITDVERQQIVRAMGFAKGHWYKCPNGHVYAIGDCGGATEESKCPECHATIGGGSHRLRADNAVATEMDGARYPAFSDHANMDNYDPNELRRLAQF